jgi:N-acetylglucosamine-6-phosphate deacetylase
MLPNLMARKKTLRKANFWNVLSLIVLFLCFYSPLHSKDYWSPKVIVYPDAFEQSRAAAEAIAKIIEENNLIKKRTILGLATGSTPIPLYQELIRIIFERQIDLNNVYTFNLDEYIGLPSDHPESYHRFMDEHLFNQISYPNYPLGIYKDHIFIPNGMAKKSSDLSFEEQLDLENHFKESNDNKELSHNQELWILNRRAKAYDELINTLGPIDLQILGIGTNGHIGFAEPGSPMDGPTMVIELSKTTREDNARFFEDNIDAVPRFALTMGIGTILKAKEILLLAIGPSKANIIQKTLQEPPNDNIPATALFKRPRVTFNLDQLAASHLICKDKTTRYFNGLVVKNGELHQQDLYVSKGKIVEPTSFVYQNIDLKGAIVAPGYIDLQINGAYGYDFTSNPEKVEDVAYLLPKHGVTSFLPTLISSSNDVYAKAIPRIDQIEKERHGSNLLGIHLEGPFLNPERSGAHNKDDLQTFACEHALFLTYGSLKGVKIVTLAPELPNALEAIAILRNSGIIVSAGHTNANYDEMQTAVNTGVTLVTHLFNAMSPLNHRSPGVIGAAFTNPLLYYCLIADGKHIDPILLNIAWKARPEGLILVTDAIEAMGLPDGEYVLGKKQITVSDGKATILGTDILAGSVIGLDRAVKNFRQWTGCSLAQAIDSATLKPAKLLGINKGALEAGYDADFILLTRELKVKATFISGELVWREEL